MILLAEDIKSGLIEHMRTGVWEIIKVNKEMNPIE